MKQRKLLKRSSKNYKYLDLFVIASVAMMIIANTVKGKGVSFMEGQAKWHGKAPKRDELNKALKELGY